ncbi:hypothetical protein [Streptomyces sp. NPDC005969]|uniref:hypothetical protein n=1 Tax=Streptomyces sp. NPDC005969 TaxID=3156722 RepID=UPI0033C91AD2
MTPPVAMAGDLIHSLLDGMWSTRSGSLLPAEPNRPFRLRADRVDRVDPHGGTVRITAV